MTEKDQQRLLDALTRVRKRIEQVKVRRESIGEENTKSTLIDPILTALGWNLEELEEVCREYRRKPQDNPVDYALFMLRSPCLFVEAKALDKELYDRKWASQIISYAAVVGVEWCILTNGDEYRIYNSHATVDIDEKIFRTIRVSDETQEQYTLDTLDLLSKSKMGEKLIDTLWKAHFVDHRVKAALVNILHNDDGALTRLVRKKIPGLSRSEIRDSLKRADFRVDFPVIAFREPTKPVAPRKGDKGAIKPPVLTKGDKLKLDYWTAFNEYLVSHNKPINIRKAWPAHWYDVSIGKGGVHIALTLRTNIKDISCEIYMHADDAKALFQFLLRDRKAIEEVIGPLEWQELPEKQASRIVVRKKLDPTEKEAWDECFQWYLATIAKFKKAFVPRIQDNYLNQS
jgi:predicted type IV restriction endonuclease